MLRRIIVLSLAAFSVSFLSGCAGCYSFGREGFFARRNASPECCPAPCCPTVGNMVYDTPIVDFAGPCCGDGFGSCGACGDVTAFGAPAFGAPLLVPGPVALPPVGQPTIVAPPATINGTPRLSPIPQAVPQATPIPAPLN